MQSTKIISKQKDKIIEEIKLQVGSSKVICALSENVTVCSS